MHRQEKQFDSGQDPASIRCGTAPARKLIVRWQRCSIVWMTCSALSRAWRPGDRIPSIALAKVPLSAEYTHREGELPSCRTMKKKRRFILLPSWSAIHYEHQLMEISRVANPRSRTSFLRASPAGR